MVMDARQQLLDWIEADRDKLVGFFSEFVSKPSPNPPGVTTGAELRGSHSRDANNAGSVPQHQHFTEVRYRWHRARDLNLHLSSVERMFVTDLLLRHQPFQ